MEIGRIERRKAFLRTLLSLAICLSLLLTVKAFAAQTIGPLSISLSDKNLVATYEGVRASKTLGTGKDGTVDVVVDGGNSFTATVKSAHKYVGSKGYPASNMTITLKNGYDTPARLKFSYTITDGKGTVTVDQINESGEVTRKPFNKEIPGGGDITIKIVSSANKVGCDSGVVLKIEDIELEQVVTTATTTFIPGEHGSYTVNGKAVDKEISHTQKSTDKYNLNAQADDGYVFLGWLSWTKPDKTDKRYISTNNPESIGITSDCTIQPVFIPEDSAQFSVGSEVFYDLNAANAYALTQTTKTIVLIKSGTIPVDQYKIDSGVTLLIPYSSSTEVHTTKPSNSDTVDIKADRSAYRTLTVPSGTTINVYGALNVDGQISKNKSLPTGQYGLITLESGAKINLSGKDEKGNDKGGSLYCWGYINGDGLVIANSGANVYESFQLTGWRGGGASQTIVGDAGKKRVFPINQYYIQNVEAALQFHYGAKEYVYASVEVTIPLIGKQQYDVTTEFISMNAGMFRLQPGCTFTKKYIPATDRMLFEVDGDFTIGTMALNFTTIISLKTEQYDLPINSNFSVDIRSGTTTIAPNQNIALLPGAKFTVSHGAEFVAESAMYVYDRDEWIGKNYAYGGDLRGVGYSTTNGTTTMRTDADLVDATIDVNGKLRISGTKGGIYTTKNPNDPDRGSANIFSSEGTGQVIFDIATKDEATAYQVRQKGNDVEGYDEIPCDSAQLRNGDGTYTETAGAQAGWTYKYDTVQQRWYRFRVDYQFNGKNIGYDLITTDTATRDVSDYITEGNSLTAEVVKPTTSNIKGEFNGNILTVSGIDTNCTINIKGVAASYTPYFVLNEHQYGVYLSYGGTKITNKVTIDNKTYYVVESHETMEFGAALSAPSDEKMGVSKASHNSITWFLEDVTTGAQQFMGTVPSGTTKGKPVYIYGIYSGAVAHNSYTNEYYTNLKDAIVDLPVTGSATLTMYANCGTFEDESKTASYSLSANITFDVNGKEVWGSLVNNGTLTLVDAKGGKIITEAVSTNGSLQNYASVVRNNGTLTMEGVTLVGTQTTNDYFAGVMNYTGGKIMSIKDCNVKVQRGYGVYNYGGTIDIIDGGSITGKYGINNRNVRGNSYSTSGGATIAAYGRIGTITNVNIDVRQYAIYNGALIDEISGNSNLTATPASKQVPMSGYTESNTPAYTVYNSNAWYYDTSIWRRTDDTSSGVLVRTDEYTPDNKPTIGKITGNVTITAVNTSNSVEHGYAVENQGRIEEISGNAVIQTYVHSGNSAITYSRHALRNESGGIVDLIGGNVTISAGDRGIYNAGSETIKNINTYETTTATTPMSTKTTYRNASKIVSINGDSNGSGVTIEAVKNQYGILNYAAIGDITGKVTIKANNGSYGLSNQGDSANSYYEYTLSADKTVRKYYYERISSSVGTIGGDSSEIRILSKNGYALMNAGTIDAILGGVTIQATTGSTSASSNTASLHNNEGRQKTYTEWRTNLGTNAVTSGNYDTKFDRYYTYEEQGGYIGKIEGNVKVTTGGYYALSNYGTIGSISNGVQLTAKNHYALYNWAHYDNYRRSINYYHGTSAFSVAWADRYFDETTVDYTRKAASIGAINDVTIQANSYAIHNGGDIGSIANSVIKATGERAVNNTGGTTLYYLDTTVKNLTEKNTNQLVTYDSTTGKYSFTTKNREVKYGGGTIGLLGGNNKISGTTNVIMNSGEIKEINNTDGQGNVLQKSTITATTGYGIYNYKGFTTARSMTAGTDAVLGYTSATIGTIANTEVTAVSYSLRNGDADGSYTAIAINELGSGNVFKSSSNACVCDCNYATIGKISGGSYTGSSGCVLIETNSKLNEITGGTFRATSTDTYALKNNNTSAAIAISVGPTFLGGTDSRSYAIYDADTRQTYPEGCTLSNKPNKDGYYYIAEKKFVLKFDANGSTTYPATGTVDAMTVTLPAESVTLPANGFTRSGYIFAGWALDKNIGAESEKKLLPGSIELSKLGDPGAGDEVTLYAIWQPDKVYNVTVNWNGTLAYTYVPSVYQWDAENLRYEIRENSYWKGDNPTVTVTNVGGNKAGVTYGSINAGIGYTKKIGYDTFDMNFYIGDETVAYKNKATLASGLMPGGQSAKARMELIGTLPSGMAQGTLTIGTVALTLTTAD